jgi:cold shock CspA family protein
VQFAITFREMESSAALTERAQTLADKLAAMHPRILRCEVSIENTHRRHQHGPRFRVRIHLDVPGQDIEISRDQGDYEDANVALADAFRAAKRRLVDHVRTTRGDVKHSVEPAHGWVSYLDDKGEEYGFLEDATGEQFYFHRNAVLSGYEQLELGDEVRFAVAQGREGRQASTVDRIGDQGRHHQVPPEARPRHRPGREPHARRARH